MRKEIKLKKTDTIWLHRTTKGNLNPTSKTDRTVGECLINGSFSTCRGTMEFRAWLTDETKNRIEALPEVFEVFDDECVFNYGYAVCDCEFKFRRN